jgi:hypothetical protein
MQHFLTSRQNGAAMKTDKITKYPKEVAIALNVIVAKTNASDLRRICTAGYVGIGCCSRCAASRAVALPPPLCLLLQPVASRPLHHECPRVLPTVLGELFMKPVGRSAAALKTVHGFRLHE